MVRKSRETSEYRAWSDIKTRCYNPKSKDYPRYGERGITMCDRWLNSFQNFLSDMGIKPYPSASIDRINNNDGYHPKNCRWATKLEQVQNCGMYKNNTSGTPGVYWNKVSKKWFVQFKINKKLIRCGSFMTKDEAISVCLREKERYKKTPPT